MRIRQNAVKFFFLTACIVVVQRIQAGLIAQQQPRIDPYRMLHRTEATLAPQLTVPFHADIQKMVAQLIHTACTE